MVKGKDVFEPETIVKAWSMVALLRSIGITLKHAIAKSVNLVFALGVSHGVCHNIDSGEFRLLGASTMQKTEYRLDLLERHYQREQMALTFYARHLLPVSSLQLSFSIFAVVDRICFPKAMNMAELARHVVESNWLARHMNLVTLVHGRAGVVGKALALHHQIAHDTGTRR